jgi:thiol-disulfide isomerase/thioredoxin
MTVRASLLPLAAVLVLLAACGQEPRPGAAARDAPPVPFAGCAGLAQPPPDASSSGAPVATGPAPPPLPSLSLPCYAGGGDVDVAAVRGPAVVNVWASWCRPCRHELPLLQRFADRNPGGVHVIGVVSADDRAAALALAGDLGLRFPHLYDGDGALMRAVERNGLPVTLFVDAQGRVREVYNAKALDQPTLDRLAARHLGLVPT